MASVIYGNCYLRQMDYGKCNYGKSIMTNETEPYFVCFLIERSFSKILCSINCSFSKIDHSFSKKITLLEKIGRSVQMACRCFKKKIKNIKTY